ncbi:EAL domain-containing protein [Chitinimonas lacunae]|uniref:EAL domain-containing protein n=1 Tax=Chitinimonas lacunae TaxID=1963018 RepID=A0ABV8MRA8_9NEIS
MATVLIVDDRAINRQFLRTLLGYGGYQTIEADDGDVALEKVWTERPDLLIADILMPRMNGLEMARCLRADPRLAHLPIIFYTATYRLRDAQELAATCGAARVLAKPAEPKVILDTVAEVLGDRARWPSEPLQDAAPTELAPTPHDTEGLSLRLSALLELGLELNLQRDPQQLIELCCRAAQDILTVRCSGVAIVGETGQLQRHATQGLADRRLLQAIDPCAGPWGMALRSGRLVRLDEAETAAAGLPPGHPPVRHMLVVPLHTSQRCYGWLYLADRLNGAGFDDADEQLALALAAQLAQCYENLEVLEQVQRHAEQLEIEVSERQLALVALQESESRFRQVAGNIREMFYLVTADLSQILYISPAFEAIWGIPCQQLYQEPESWFSAIHPDDVSRVIAAIGPDSLPQPLQMEYRLIRPDGSCRWVQNRSFPVYDTQGKVYRLAGICEDITERHERNVRISRLSRILAVLSGINSAIVRIRDRQELLQEACDIAVHKGEFLLAWIGELDEGNTGRVVAWRGGQCDPTDRLLLSSAPDSPDAYYPANQALRLQRPVICNDLTLDPQLLPFCGRELQHGFRAIAALPWRQEGHGGAVMVLYAGEPGFFDADELRLLGELVGDLCFGLDYIERERQLAYLALYDPLTGLPNRKLLLDQLTLLLGAARHEQRQLAVLVLDLDHFRQINDHSGRHIGDQLLQEVAQRWRAVLAEPACLARLEADVFAVVLTDLNHKAEAASLLGQQLIAALAQPFETGERALRLDARAGVALFPDDADDAPTLLRNAESAVKQAKLIGERYLYYDLATHAVMTEKLALEEAMRLALEQRRFEMYYQPRIDLVRGEMVGAEALLRWNDPAHGQISPARFIPLAEETGLIVPLGEWVIDAVCAQQAIWLAQGLPIVPVALNLSAVQFNDVHLPQTLQAALERHKLPSDYLELELTESAVMRDPDRAIRLLYAFRELGFKLSLDDFGTGYSSLAYLKRFPFDCLKIDRAFVTDLTRNADDAAIATAIIALAHQLKLRTVAEGVETEAQLNFLRRHGCDEMQGFYFSRPLEAEDFSPLLCSGCKLTLTALSGEA